LRGGEGRSARGRSFSRLNNFAKAFALLYETEDALRNLMPQVLGQHRVFERNGALSANPRTDWLDAVLDEKKCIAPLESNVRHILSKMRPLASA